MRWALFPSAPDEYCQRQEETCQCRRHSHQSRAFGQVVGRVERITDPRHAPQIPATPSNHELSPHALLHMLRHVTVHQVSPVVSGHDECPLDCLAARGLDVKHAHGIEVVGQAVDHPLVPNGIFIDEGELASWMLETILDFGEQLIVTDPKINKWLGKSKQKDDAIDAENWLNWPGGNT